MNRADLSGERITRRRFLRIAGVAGLGVLAFSRIRWDPSLASNLSPIARRRLPAFWSDPRTWGGQVPGKNDFVVVSKPITLDVDVHVRGIAIKRKGNLVFHPRRNVTLRSTSSVVVRGELTMRPSRPAVVHRLIFPEIDEKRFVGDGNRVILSDVGLWVTARGRLDLHGSSKLAWTRAAGGVPAGSTSITLQHDPSGWRIGDEIVLTPTLPPTTSNHDVAYDLSTVTAVDHSSRRVTLRSPTQWEHPAVEVEPGVVLTAEVLNVTRNVRIEGSPGGRSHVWIRSRNRQNISHAGLRYTGPRRPRADPNLPASTEPIPGRYGLHFHEMEDSARGSTVVGLVVRDSGNHAFVTHRSHGVTFRDCISHNTLEEAYWWDPSPHMHMGSAPPTDDVLYNSCVASMVRSDPPWWGLRLAGFFLGARNGNVIRNCVAVGIQGNVDSSGFIWPETSGGLWKFEDCLAHNNRMNGIFSWQNNEVAHVIRRFTAYHNGHVGINHGSYINSFLYDDCVLYGNRSGAIESHALSFSSTTQTFSRIRCDQAGLSDYCVVTKPHLAEPMAPVQFVESRFRGYAKAAFGFLDEASPFPNLFNVTDCVFEGNEFWLGPAIHAASLIRLDDPTHGSLTLRRSDQPGLLRPEWNASVSPIG